MITFYRELLVVNVLIELFAAKSDCKRFLLNMRIVLFGFGQGSGTVSSGCLPWRKATPKLVELESRVSVTGSLTSNNSNPGVEDRRLLIFLEASS